MERYRGYVITPIPQKTRNGRYSVAVRLASDTGAETQDASGETAGSPGAGESVTYFANDGIAYILYEEAIKESIIFAQHLIDRGVVREKYLR